MYFPLTKKKNNLVTPKTRLYINYSVFREMVNVNRETCNTKTYNNKK